MKLPPTQVTMQEVTDPQAIAEFQARWAQAERNSAWLQAHAHEIYTQQRGKFIVVSGEELFVRDTPEEAFALAKAAHSEDQGSLSRYIYPKRRHAFKHINGEWLICEDGFVSQALNASEGRWLASL